MTASTRPASWLGERVRDVPDYPTPGVLFKDIGPLLADPVAFAAAVDALVPAPPAGGAAVDKVAGIEARGFILAAPVAHAMRAGFVPVRKAGKLPGPTLQASYALEYGQATLEVAAAAVTPGDRVLLVDDVLATGGTVNAAIAVLQQAGAHVVAVSVLMELVALGGRARLAGVDVHAVLTA